jgi:cell division protease FtsH
MMVVVSRKKTKDDLARTYLAAQAATQGAQPKKSSWGRNDGATEKAARPSAIKAEFATATVMLARAVERVRGLDRQLRTGSQVVTVAVGDATLLHTVGKVLRLCCFPENDVHEDKLNGGVKRPVLLIVRNGSEKEKVREASNGLVADALHLSALVVGVAPEPSQHLPSFMVRAADHHLALERLDASGIALVIEAVTGRAPSTAIEEDVARSVDLSAIMLSVVPHRDADDCVDRLRRMVAARRTSHRDGPGLEDLIGYGAARDWGLNLVKDLNLWRSNSLPWSALETSLLVFGPPGTGKTKFASALSNSTELPLVATSVAEWNSAPYLHGTLEAMKTALSVRGYPYIAFVDEVDGVGDRANTTGEWSTYYNQIQNLALELFSKAHQSKIVLVCASNFPERIDPALMRSGRIDRKIEIGLPDTVALAGIFGLYLGNDLSRADLKKAALRAAGHTGADVEVWARAARARARRADRPLSIDDLIAEIGEGRPAPPPWLRRSGAIHEVGHLVGALAEGICEPQELFLSHDGGGVARMKPNRADMQTRGGLEKYIVALLSGRAAEEVVFGAESVTIGSGGDAGLSDLGVATSVALNLETRFGMGALGVAQFSDSATEALALDPVVNKGVRHRLDRCFLRAKAIIETNRRSVTAIAAVLDRLGHLDREAIAKLLNTYRIRPPPALPKRDDGYG